MVQTTSIPPKMQTSKANLTVKLDLPNKVTGSDLHNSKDFVAGIQSGVASHLNVKPIAIDVTGTKVVCMDHVVDDVVYVAVIENASLHRLSYVLASLLISLSREHGTISSWRDSTTIPGAVVRV